MDELTSSAEGQGSAALRPTCLATRSVRSGARARGLRCGHGLSEARSSRAEGEPVASPCWRTAAKLRRPQRTAPGLFTWLLAVPKPIISAVNGVAAGGGFVLTAMSDLRIASTAGSFTSVFSKRGLIAEHGMTWLVPRLIGTGAALDLLWSSRKIDSSSADGQGFAAHRPACLATGSPLPGARPVDHPGRRWRSCTSLDRTAGTRRQACWRRAAKLRPPQGTAGAAALMEKRPPSFPRLGG